MAFSESETKVDVSKGRKLWSPQHQRSTTWRPCPHHLDNLQAIPPLREKIRVIVVYVFEVNGHKYVFLSYSLSAEKVIIG
jgi:hypothetical protein